MNAGRHAILAARLTAAKPVEQAVLVTVESPKETVAAAPVADFDLCDFRFPD